jgi:hypothetical protein
MSALDPASAYAGRATARVQTPATTVGDQFLHFALYITVLSGAYVVFEPAPYEFLAAVLAFACVLARIRFDRVILPLLVLLLIRDAGGVIGLFQILGSGFMRVSGEPSAILSEFGPDDSIRFLAISFYLGLTAVVFACIVAQDTMRAIATVRSAYILCGVVAGLFGTLGYFAVSFNSMPALQIFAMNERAVGGFKDPNVLGCFLIPPLIWLIEGFIVDKIRLTGLVGSIIMFLGMLLSLSRAAWGGFAFCIVLLMYLLFVTQPDRRLRIRIAFFTIGGAVALAAIVALLSSVDVVRQMLTERVALQSYDFGADNRSRFLLQEDSWREILNHPLGMGPWGFAHMTSWVSHNTYLGTLLNHGWLGGIAYLTLVVLTLYVGFKTLWIRAPWQTFLIATYLSFVALAAEGFIVDTDHWRHFYLLLGLVWGLAAATLNFQRRGTYQSLR